MGGNALYQIRCRDKCHKTINLLRWNNSVKKFYAIWAFFVMFVDNTPEIGVG